MRSRSLTSAAAAAMILTFSAAAALAQDASTPAVKSPTIAARPAEQKPNLLAQLGLSRDQVQQIRVLNADRKPLMEAAQNRLKAANAALDSAIYGDDANDVDVDLCVKEVQAAQGEVIRIRSASELAVRRVLTPEQLVRFRELRQKFEAMRQQIQIRRKALRNGITPGTTPPPNMLKHVAHPN